MLEDQLSEEEDYGEDDYGNNYFDAGEEEGTEIDLRFYLVSRYMYYHVAVLGSSVLYSSCPYDTT
jgi:hypothetical protein